MATFTRPDTYAEEVVSLEGPIQDAATGFGGLQGITQKGPVGVPVRTRNFEDWKKVFGRRELRSDMAYEAKMFFDEGGVELLTLRQAHFTDIDDRTTFAGVAASRTITTEGIAAQAAMKEGAPELYVLNPGDSFTLDVDNVGPAVVTFDAARATRAGVGLAIVDLTGDTLIVAIDGGANQTILFTGTETTAALVAAAINAQIVGGFAAVNLGEVDISSDVQGTASSVQIVGGTALAEIGHTVGTATGTGDVANIAAVTALEVETRVEADTTANVTVLSGVFTIVSPTVGAASELDFVSGVALAKLGLSVEVLTGTAAGGTQNTLELESGYHGELSPGLRGNDLETKVIRNPRHPSQGAGLDIVTNVAAAATSIRVTTLQGLEEKSIIKLQDGATVEYHEVLATRTEVLLGVVAFYIDLVGSVTNPFLAASSTLESREFDLEIYEDNTLVETWSQLSMLDTADNYVETVLNDADVGSEFVVATDLDAPAGIGADLPANDAAKVFLTGGSDETAGLVDADWIGSEIGGTGLYGWDSVREFMPIATVNKNSAAVIHAGTLYAERRMFFEFITYSALGLSAAGAKAFRENTVGVSSSYGSMYAGGVKLFDPEGAGKNPRRDIVGLGGQMGLRARVDALPVPNGGPWQSPAGEGDYGRLRSALGVVDEYTDTDHGVLNAAGINVIRKFGRTSPVLTFGARTLDASTAGKFRYINTRRMFQFFEKSIVDGTRFGVLRNNDFRLWSKLVDRVLQLLRAKQEERAFPGATEKENFFVKMGIPSGTMTQSDVDNGRAIGEIGMAPQKPGEFIIWRFTQFEGGATIEEQT